MSHDSGSDPKLVAKGQGAFGVAGRTGSWDEILVIVKDGSVLRVKPSRGDAYYLYFQESQVSQLCRDDLDLLGLIFDSENRKRI